MAPVVEVRVAVVTTGGATATISWAWVVDQTGALFALAQPTAYVAIAMCAAVSWGLAAGPA